MSETNSPKMTDSSSGAGETSATAHIRLDRQRWTHMALIVKNMESSIAWYEEYTHLRLFKRNQDDSGYGAWMVDPEQPDPPFILVMAEFFEGKDPFAPSPHHPIGPFAHFGIELTSKKAVDDMAEKGKKTDCLAFGPMQMPDPVGYICFLTDPDGNTIEFSYGQGVYEAVRTEWDASVTELNGAERIHAYLAAFSTENPLAVLVNVHDDFLNEHYGLLGKGCVGKNVYAERLTDFFQGFRHIVYDVQDVVTDRKRGSCRYVFNFIQDNKPFAISGLMWFEFKDGLISRRVDCWDSLSYLKQAEATLADVAGLLDISK